MSSRVWGIAYNRVMSEREEKRGGSGCAIGLVLVFMFLPVVYVLSIGPAALLAKHYPAAENTLGILYFPLMFLAKNCSPIESGLLWYTKLWV